MNNKNELEIKDTSCLKRAVKHISREIKQKPFLRTNGLFEKEALGVLRGCGQFRVLFDGELPYLGVKICALEEINNENVIALLESCGLYLTNDEFNSLLWQCHYIILKEAADVADEGTAEKYIKKMYLVNELDETLITETVSPLARLFSSDETYLASTVETRAQYRDKTAEIAADAGIDERRLSLEIKTRAEKEQRGIGEIIYEDYRRVFHHTNIAAYLWAVLGISRLISLAIGFFTSWTAGLIAYFPCIAITKPLCDIVAAKFTRRSGYLPRLEFQGKIPKDCKTAVVLSALIGNEKDIPEALLKLKQAKIRNRQGNIFFCLLCDLPASANETDVNDAAVISAIPEACSKAFPEAVVIVRKRSFSKTQRKWQGRERKRGAIDELVRFFSGEDISFAAVYGNSEKLIGTKYLVALDFDTLPLLDSVYELVSIAAHPLNSRYGIIAPRISSSLTSTLRTTFSKLMGGNGGVSGISAYDSVAGEFYSDCFGEGIFTGKGLISVPAFYEKTKGVLPDERVLSHDILEGGLLNVVFAGDVEFYDSFPPASKAYFKRQHRWLRGDFQNIRFIFYRQFTSLTKFKLFDNIRRGLDPIFILALLFFGIFTDGGWLLTLTALVTLFMPFLPAIFFSLSRGLGFGLKRRFYSPIIPETSQYLQKALCELITLPYSDAVSTDAALKTIWRLLVSKRNLLQWTTSGMLEKTAFSKSYLHFVSSLVLSLVLLFCAVLERDAFVIALAVLMIAGVPFLIYADRETSRKAFIMTGEMRKNLLSQVEKMWSFYVDFVTEDNAFLPPDNVQQRPVYRIARRTSPTNIGMYLLSAVCVNELEIISNDELFCRVCDTIETVEKLEKYNGNLYNWYDTLTLQKLGGFVSTVDSGNFLCCLVAVKEALKEKNADFLLIARLEKLIAETNLKMFYNTRKKLFSIGFDADKNALSEHFYDMLMSEARMTGYFAVATGTVPKSHWRALGRTMSKCGRFAGPVAWTGTMFEFFMPELLLTSKEGSLSYEALRYALYCQKRRFTPWGISESGYYAFDKDMNYQYKAHGVQKIALKSGMNRERVVSPYSSFLTLSTDCVSSYNNLVRLEKDGAFDNRRYGFYEAVDYTVKRVGRNACAVVKSHMAHHVGMSIIGAANALENNIAGRYFMQDERMQSASELLEERVMAGEKILDISDYKEDTPLLNELEKISDISAEKPRVNILSNSAITLFTSDCGISLAIYDGKDVVRRTDDILRRPHGEFFAFLENERVMPFLEHPYLSPENCDYSATFSGRESAYLQKHRDLSLEMTVCPCGDKSAYVRRFSAENLTKTEKTLTLCAYIEPSLSKPQDVAAHPMFSDFFLKIRYERANKLFIASRKSRSSSKQTVMVIGFTGDEDFTFSLNREEVLLQNEPLSFFHSGNFRSTSEISVPSPCIFIKALIPLDALEKRSAMLFTVLGDDEKNAVKRALSIRNGGYGAEFVNPLSRSSIQGSLAAKTVAASLYNLRSEKIEAAREDLSSDKKALWKYGISGDFPIVVYDCALGLSALRSAFLMRHSLYLCGFSLDLIVLCSNASQKSAVQRALHETTGASPDGVFFLDKEALDESATTLLYAAACYVVGDKDEEAPPENKRYLPLVPSSANGDKSGFEGEKFYVFEKSRPWCNILSNAQFGTLLSENALGFSWAHNSRENKLSPWFNDIMNDNSGEMLLLKSGGKFYDMIRGSSAVFSPNTVDYESLANGFSLSASVRIYEKGLGKELTVTVENLSDSEKTAELSYYVEGVLGVDRSAGFILAQKNSRGVSMKNPFNPYFKGSAFLATSKKHTVATDRHSFFRGENRFLPCGDMAAVIVPLKLPPRSREKIRYILGYSTESELSTAGASAVVKSASAAEIKASDNQKIYAQNATDISTPAAKKSASSPVSKTAGGQMNTGNSPIEKALETLEAEATGVVPETKIRIKTPDETLNALFNHWLPWQALGCRLWGRTGFYQNGGAYGFRDQLQDCLSILYFKPEEAHSHILRCCSAQFSDGDVLHWWHELAGVKKGVRTRYSDDLLWLPYVVSSYSEIYGDKIWSEKAPFAVGEALPEDKHELFMDVEEGDVPESVYNHCKKAREKGYNKVKNGLLKIGCGDWNDGYNEVGTAGVGTSVWLSMFYVMCGRKFASAARKNEDGAYAEKLEKRVATLAKDIEETAWDGDYYIRAFYDNGEKMGARGNPCCEIDLLPQAFAALCELPDTKKTVQAVNEAVDQLVDGKNGIIKLFTPAFSPEKTTQRPGYVMSYPEGIRENGGQYTHAAIWLCLACFKLGQKKRALSLLQMLNPALKKPEKFKNEPYFMTADIYTNPDCYGRGGWSMYTGAAAWYYKLVLEGLFGVEIKDGRLTLNPSLPKEYDGSELSLSVSNTKISAKFFASDGPVPQQKPIELDGGEHVLNVAFSLF